MPRNRSVEHWFLCLTNHLTAFQIHSSFHAKLKKNAAPKVSQPVFSWELKIYIYLNKYLLSSPAEPMLPVCPGQEGRQEQSWEAMLWTSPCSTPGSAHPCLDQTSPLSSPFSSLLPKPPCGVWFFSLTLPGCKCSKRKGSGSFSDEVIKQGEGRRARLRGSGGSDGRWAREVKELSETQTVRESF